MIFHSSSSSSELASTAWLVLSAWIWASTWLNSCFSICFHLIQDAGCRNLRHGRLLASDEGEKCLAELFRLDSAACLSRCGEAEGEIVSVVGPYNGKGGSNRRRDGLKPAPTRSVVVLKSR